MKDEPTLEQTVDLENLENAFIDALEKGFKNRAWQVMCQSNFDPNAEDGKPLQVAIELGYIDVAAKLLSDGADPNASAGKSKYPIVFALENEYFELAEQMLASGAEISIRDQKGWTPLIWAAIKGRKKVVEFLLDKESDIHICSNDGWNAITGAFFRKHTEIVQILIENGAKFGEKYKEAALLSAYEHGDMDVVKTLISDGVNVNVATAEGQPIIILAAARGDITMIDLLLDAGADINIRDIDGNPVLVNSIVNAQYKVAEHLVQKGASINVKGPNWAAIHVAAECGKTDLCEILLDSGASVDQLGGNSWTALMLACREEHIETVRLLLKYGANPNYKNKKEYSPYSLIPPYSKYESSSRTTLRNLVS